VGGPHDNFAVAEIELPQKRRVGLEFWRVDIFP